MKEYFSKFGDKFKEEVRREFAGFKEEINRKTERNTKEITQQSQYTMCIDTSP